MGPTGNVDEDYSGFVVKPGAGLSTGASGMVRSTPGDKVDYTLALDGVMFERWAAHLTRATKPRGDFPGYAKRNWLKALEASHDEKQDIMERAKESALRHIVQWYLGKKDEDHAAAGIFNLNLYETVKASYETL